MVPKPTLATGALDPKGEFAGDFHPMGGSRLNSGRWATFVEYPKAVVREADLRNQSPNGAFIAVVDVHK